MYNKIFKSVLNRDFAFTLSSPELKAFCHLWDNFNQTWHKAYPCVKGIHICLSKGPHSKIDKNYYTELSQPEMSITPIKFKFQCSTDFNF